MDKHYWLVIFNGTTWNEFLNNESKVMGFKESKEKIVSRIRLGDYLICYIIGISRFIGILEVKSDLFIDESKIWNDNIYPCRIKVDTIDILEPIYSVPALNLKNDLSIFKNLYDPKIWSSFFMSSPKQFNVKDAEIIVQAIKKAIVNRNEFPYDEKKFLKYKSKIKKKQE